MSAKYWQRGETIDYTATDDLANGDVVNLATRIGVAGDDIAAGETGAVHVVGVFEMPKATGAVTVGQAQNHERARHATADIRPAQAGAEAGRRAQRHVRRDAQAVGKVREDLLRADDVLSEIGL